MLESRKIVLRETAIIAAGEAVCCGIMVGVFALLGKFDMSVLLGAIAGFVVSVLYFFFMAVGVSMAADKAEEQNVSAGKNMIRGAMALRFLLLFLILIVLLVSKIFNIYALLLPLVFVRPVLMLGEFFRKKG